MRRGGILALVAVIGIVVALGVVIGNAVHHDGSRPGAVGPFCAAVVDGHLVELSVEQAENAALITSIAVERGLPARAASIALATALQESKLYNLDYGDRDSLGLFQQRPSQGWGTRAEVSDPVHATNAFYDALERVGDFQTLSVGVAAQDVQHSAYPDAYQEHEADARALASALTGNSPARFSCHLNGRGPIGSTAAVVAEARDRFGLSAAPAAPSGVDVAVAGPTQGWAVAQYFAAQAARLGIARIAYDGRTWTRRGSDGTPGDWARTPGVGTGAVHVDTTH